MKYLIIVARMQICPLLCLLPSRQESLQ